LKNIKIQEPVEIFGKRLVATLFGVYRYYPFLVWNINFQSGHVSKIYSKLEKDIKVFFQKPQLPTDQSNGNYKWQS
tara:strand:+ start:2151 stop:2378 length:228 start_codon:yes stop_codon:yes gene_type:complete